jgi:hypothetical protein
VTGPQTSMREVEESFAKRTRFDAKTGCWVWTGALGIDGTPRCHQNKRRGNQRLVHRVVYQQLMFPLKDDVRLTHCPESRRCINPGHLRVLVMTRANQPPRKSHCKNGHPMDEKNTRVRVDGITICRACVAAAKRNRNQAKRKTA